MEPVTMTVAIDVPTKADLHAAEDLRERWCEINSQIRLLNHTSGELHGQIQAVIDACTSAVALFESGKCGRKDEMKRELAAMRCHVKRVRVAGRIADMEAVLKKFANDLAEFKMHDQMRGILDKCAD